MRAIWPQCQAGPRWPADDCQEINAVQTPRDCERGGARRRISPRDRSRGAFAQYDIEDYNWIRILVILSMSNDKAATGSRADWRRPPVAAFYNEVLLCLQNRKFHAVGEPYFAAPDAPARHLKRPSSCWRNSVRKARYAIAWGRSSTSCGSESAKRHDKPLKKAV
jgi:hypothetical protein